MYEPQQIAYLLYLNLPWGTSYLFCKLFYIKLISIKAELIIILLFFQNICDNDFIACILITYPTRYNFIEALSFNLVVITKELTVILLVTE